MMFFEENKNMREMRDLRERGYVERERVRKKEKFLQK
jgi:hypothetical protein